MSGEQPRIKVARSSGEQAEEQRREISVCEINQRQDAHNIRIGGYVVAGLAILTGLTYAFYEFCAPQKFKQRLSDFLNRPIYHPAARCFPAE